MANYAYKKTIEKFQDMAGKWQVRVLIADDSAIFLKFDHNPTVDEVKTEVAKYIENLARQKLEELKIIDEQINGLQERKKILEQGISEP